MPTHLEDLEPVWNISRQLGKPFMPLDAAEPDYLIASRNPVSEAGDSRKVSFFTKTKKKKETGFTVTGGHPIDPLSSAAHYWNILEDHRTTGCFFWKLDSSIWRFAGVDIFYGSARPALAYLERYYLTDEPLERGRRYLRMGDKDAAAVFAGTALEAHLRVLCSKNAISVHDKKGNWLKADLLNTLLHNGKFITSNSWKEVNGWLAVRNDAAHGNYIAYERSQVTAMITFVEGFRKQYA